MAWMTGRRKWKGAWYGLLLLTCLWGEGATAQGASPSNDLTVRPVKQRISDEVIEADKQVFRQIRSKLESARAGASAAHACTLTKAEAWLDVAEEEYDENEEGAIVDVTLREAQRLLRSIDSSDAIGAATPLLLAPPTARPDLWVQLDRLRERGAACACASLAKLEVQLSWADHELLEGTSHARPYIETAERLAETTMRDVDEMCPQTASLPSPLPPVEEPTPAAVPPDPEPPALQAVDGPAPEQTPPSSEPPAPVAVVEQRGEPEPLAEPELLPESPADVISLATLPWSVHFSTNRATISSSTAKVLNQMSDVLRRHPIAQIRLEGHADQRGDASYNKTLSERRTQAVKAFLVKAGIPADNISATAFGKSQPLSRSRQNRELARNRRVVIVVTNIEEVRSEEQYADLQPDQRRRKRSVSEVKPSGPSRSLKTGKKNRAQVQR